MYRDQVLDGVLVPNNCPVSPGPKLCHGVAPAAHGSLIEALPFSRRQGLFVDWRIFQPLHPFLVA